MWIDIFVAFYVTAFLCWVIHITSVEIKQNRSFKKGFELMQRTHELVMAGKISSDEARDLRRHVIMPSPTDVAYVELRLKELGLDKK